VALSGRNDNANIHESSKIFYECTSTDTPRSGGEDRQTLVGRRGILQGIHLGSSRHLPKITVYREEPGTWHVVLPAKPANAGQLSEADLEKVAGGIVIVPISAIVGALVTAAGVSAVSESAPCLSYRTWVVRAGTMRNS
jgi:hypothetical protein